jgi:hypothetical protein
MEKLERKIYTLGEAKELIYKRSGRSFVRKYLFQSMVSAGYQTLLAIGLLTLIVVPATSLLMGQKVPAVNIGIGIGAAFGLYFYWAFSTDVQKYLENELLIKLTYKDGKEMS